MTTQYPSAPLLTNAQSGKYHPVDKEYQQLRIIYDTATFPTQYTLQDKNTIIAVNPPKKFTRKKTTPSRFTFDDNFEKKDEYFSNCCGYAVSTAAAAIFIFLVYVIIYISDGVPLPSKNETITNLTNLTNIMF
tara:strand:+ start:75 stop:473 length:399 start_codon:yes stop_codon:yes gene_type:complete